MAKILIEQNNLKIEFLIDDEKHISYSYFGSKDQNYIDFPGFFSPLCQIETSEHTHDGSHCSKHLLSPFSIQSKYVSHKEIISKNKRELIITLKDECWENQIHYVFYNNVNGFSTFSVLKNISPTPLHLEYISSFYLYGFNGGKTNESDGLYLHKATNSWHCEAQWRKTSFLDLGLFNGNQIHSMKSFKISNTGGWSTKDYLPMCVIENQNTNTSLLGQIENNGSWNIELGDHLNHYYLSMHGPEFGNNQFIKLLKPNETFQTVQASVTLGKDFEETIQEITKLRRHLIKPSDDLKHLPIIFNDYMHALWDGQKEQDIIPLVDIASKVGADIFCIDAGWFGQIPWTDEIGEWEEDPTNYPTLGLKGVCDYIYQKGMKPGLWVEIECMGLKCNLINKLPDDWFFIVNGHRAIRNNRNILNFANPEVYKWAMDKVCKLIDNYQLCYLKNDYNVDTGVGNEYNSDSLGEGLLKHNRAFIRWLIELSNKYPHLTIENCGSGGCRMDYEMLKVCPIQSTSDQTDYRKYPYLSSNVLTAVLPEQAAVWSYPVNVIELKDQPVTNEIIATNMVNAILGRIHLASFINKLNDEQLDLIKEGLAFIRSISNFKKEAVPIYPNGISYFYDKEVVGGLINDKEGVLCIWNTSGNSREITVNLEKYGITDVEIAYPKSLKTNYQFNKTNKVLTFKTEEDYSGRCFRLIK
ncbi:MAG: alpha-galactosidase [Bacilli bacterium]|nr:alpha-galactosidase [Bacilli bacterium]